MASPSQNPFANLGDGPRTVQKPPVPVAVPPVNPGPRSKAELKAQMDGRDFEEAAKTEESIFDGEGSFTWGFGMFFSWITFIGGLIAVCAGMSEAVQRTGAAAGAVISGTGAIVMSLSVVIAAVLRIESSLWNIGKRK